MNLETRSPEDLLYELAHAHEWNPKDLLLVLKAFCEFNAHLFEPEDEADGEAILSDQEYVAQFRFIMCLLEAVLERSDITGLEEHIEYEGERYIALVRSLTSVQVREIMQQMPCVGDVTEELTEDEISHLKELLVLCLCFFLEVDDDDDDDDDEYDDEPMWDPDAPVLAEERELVGV